MRVFLLSHENPRDEIVTSLHDFRESHPCISYLPFASWRDKMYCFDLTDILNIIDYVSIVGLRLILYEREKSSFVISTILLKFAICRRNKLN